MNALSAAFKMRDKCTSAGFLTKVSIGVTTGLAYVGCVGHHSRQEYTVIGSVVNRAARLFANNKGFLFLIVHFAKYV